MVDRRALGGLSVQKTRKTRRSVLREDAMISLPLVEQERTLAAYAGYPELTAAVREVEGLAAQAARRFKGRTAMDGELHRLWRRGGRDAPHVHLARALARGARRVGGHRAPR